MSSYSLNRNLSHQNVLSQSNAIKSPRHTPITQAFAIHRAGSLQLSNRRLPSQRKLSNESQFNQTISNDREMSSNYVLIPQPSHDHMAYIDCLKSILSTQNSPIKKEKHPRAMMKKSMSLSPSSSWKEDESKTVLSMNEMTSLLQVFIDKYLDLDLYRIESMNLRETLDEALVSYMYTGYGTERNMTIESFAVWLEDQCIQRDIAKYFLRSLAEDYEVSPHDKRVFISLDRFYDGVGSSDKFGHLQLGHLYHDHRHAFHVSASMEELTTKPNK